MKYLIRRTKGMEQKEHGGGLDAVTRRALIEHLGSFVTDHKKNMMDQVLAERTDHLALVLEDIYQPHNASACLRTCECLGVQNIHIIEGRNRYEVNPDVVMGSVKWLTLHRYREPGRDNTAACISRLRELGYRVVATSPRADGYTPEDLPLDRPAAILFGTEEMGLSTGALAEADLSLRIPMYGFTESLNISVSVAVVFSHLMRRLRASGVPWRLSEKHREELRLAWYRKVISRSADIEKAFLAARGGQCPKENP